MYENNTAAVMVGNEVRSCFCIKSGVKQECVVSSFIWIILMDFVLRSTGKAMIDHGIKWGKNFPGLRLCWWFKHPRWKFEQNVLTLEVLRVQGARIVRKLIMRRLNH